MAGGGSDDARRGQVYEPPGALSAYAVHHRELGDIWVFAGAAGDCECDCAVSGEDAARPDRPADADGSPGGAYACDAGGGAAAVGGGAEPGPSERGGADADARLPQASAAGAGARTGWSGAGGLVAEG